MKLTKKMWIITCIMLVITLVSFSVVGTTYAKYASNVTGAAPIKAAGFFIQGETPATATISTATKIAPGDSVTINVPINYFSQVPTSFRALSDVNLVGFGVLADFDLLLSEYAAYKIRLDKSGVTPEDLSDSFTISFGNNSSVVTEMISLLTTAGLNVLTPTDNTFTDPIVSAMSASATTPLQLSMPVTITWINHTNSAWDAWDTFLGEKFYQSNVVSGVQVSLELVAEQYEGEVS